MASLHKTKKSRFWHCSFYDPVAGQWRLRSTRTTDKAAAQGICFRYESLAKSAAQPGGKVGPADAAELTEAGLRLIQKATAGDLTEDSAREFVNRVLKASGESAIDGQTVSQFLDGWLAGKKLARSEHTAQKYRTTVKLFKNSLGKKADKSLSTVTPKDIERFRDSRLRDVGASTVADDQKILHTAFKSATRQGLVQRNVVEAVDLPKSESKSRDAFTVEEVDLLVKTTDEREWKTAILVGFYAGFRLGDAVALEWKSVDLESQMLRYRAAKTGRTEEVPLNRKLLRHLKSIKGSRKGKICPALHAQKIPGRSGLSRKFLQIVEAAGIDAGTIEPEDGKGRSFTSKSFHSLRHGFVSALANAGISPEFRQKLAGHTTADTHRKYTHLEAEVLRQAINKI
jgi:integrase